MFGRRCALQCLPPLVVATTIPEPADRSAPTAQHSMVPAQVMSFSAPTAGGSGCMCQLTPPSVLCITAPVP